MRTVDCAACGARFAVPDELFTRAVAGRQRRMVCKRCGAHVVVDGTCVTGVEAPWIVAFGPDDDRELTTRQLREAIAAERVQGSTLVWRDGMEDWVALRTVEEFASAFGPRPAAGSAPDPGPAAPDPTPEATPEPDDGEDDGSGAQAPIEPSAPARPPSPIPPPRVVALPHPRSGPGAPGRPGSGSAAGERAGAASDASPTGAMHALFTVESIPPVAELSDAEVLSLPPSRPARGPSPPVLIPRAARLPREPASAPTPEPAPLADATFDVEVTDEAEQPDGIDVTLEEAPKPERGAAGAASGDAGRGARALRRGWLAVGATAGVALIASGLLLRSQRGGARDAAGAAREPGSAAVAPRPPSTGNAAAREAPAAPAAPELDHVERAAVPTPADATRPPPASAGARPTAIAPRRDGPLGAAAPTASVTAAGANDRARRTAAASGSSAPATPAAPAAAGAAFDRAAAASALSTAAAAASSCRRGADPSGTAMVTVTFAPSGRVTSVNVAGPPFAGTATGGCIATTLRRATVPPFAGSHVTVSKRIVVQ